MTPRRSTIRVHEHRRILLACEIVLVAFIGLALAWLLLLEPRMFLWTTLGSWTLFGIAGIVFCACSSHERRARIREERARASLPRAVTHPRRRNG